MKMGPLEKSISKLLAKTQKPCPQNWGQGFFSFNFGGLKYTNYAQ
jgi:hypothetical protein